MVRTDLENLNVDASLTCKQEQQPQVDPACSDNLTSSVQTPSLMLTSSQDQLKMALQNATKATKHIRLTAMLATIGIAYTTPSIAACRAFTSDLLVTRYYIL